MALLLLVALVLGALLTRAREVSGRPLADALARRIARAPDRPSAANLPVPPPPTLQGATPAAGPRELFRAGARRFVGLNGLACYLRRSTAAGDANRVGDDIADAVDCFNPIAGWTGEVGGRDGG